MRIARALLIPAPLRTVPKAYLPIASRALWISVALLAVTIFVFSALAYYRQATAGAVPAFMNAQDHILSREVLEGGTASLGLSPASFAGYMVALVAAFCLVCVATGTLIFWHRSHSPFALGISLWLVLLGTTFTPIGAALPQQFPALSGPAEMLRAAAFAGLFVLFFLFPDGRFVPRWTRWVVLLFLFLLAFELALPESPLNPTNRWALATPLALGLTVLSLLYSHVYRYRRISSLVERQQTKWVILAMISTLVIYLGIPAVDQALAFHSEPLTAILYDLIGGTIVMAAFTTIPVAIGFAVLRRRLWDIDVLINRALVFLSLSAILTGVYLLMVSAMGRLFSVHDNQLVALLAAAAVAVLFAPLRDLLQRTVNRVIYGERDDPYAVLARLGKQLELKLDPDSVLPTILDTLVSALKLPYAAIHLQQDGLRLAAKVGTGSTAPLELPLINEGSVLGSLTVGQREGEAAFSRRDRRLLEDFVRQVNMAAKALLLREETLRLADDLQRSRQRLVSAREEERLRLRRDLHDGLGPALASQTLLLDAGRKLLEHEPERAKALFTKLSLRMQTGVEEIRRVVHGLRPPALDELGLVEALKEHAHLVTREGTRASVSADSLPPLPAAVEVAAYRIALEAMTNVVRHADARSFSVRLATDSSRERALLILEVRDDGRGLPHRYQPGVGLRAMEERAAELGGRCRVTALEGGGTLVRAELPIGAEASGAESRAESGAESSVESRVES